MSTNFKTKRFRNRLIARGAKLEMRKPEPAFDCPSEAEQTQQVEPPPLPDIMAHHLKNQSDPGMAAVRNGLLAALGENVFGLARWLSAAGADTTVGPKREIMQKNLTQLRDWFYHHGGWPEHLTEMMKRGANRSLPTGGLQSYAAMPVIALIPPTIYDNANNGVEHQLKPGMNVPDAASQIRAAMATLGQLRTEMYCVGDLNSPYIPEEVNGQPNYLIGMDGLLVEDLEEMEYLPESETEQPRYVVGANGTLVEDKGEPEHLPETQPEPVVEVPPVVLAAPEPEPAVPPMESIANAAPSDPARNPVVEAALKAGTKPAETTTLNGTPKAEPRRQPGRSRYQGRQSSQQPGMLETLINQALGFISRNLALAIAAGAGIWWLCSGRKKTAAATP